MEERGAIRFRPVPRFITRRQRLHAAVQANRTSFSRKLPLVFGVRNNNGRCYGARRRHDAMH